MFMRPGPYGPKGMYGPPGYFLGMPMGPGGGPQRQRFYVSHHSFDPILAENHFGKAGEEVDDSEFSAALVKKTQELTPSTAEQSSVQNLVTKVYLYIWNSCVTK